MVYEGVNPNDIKVIWNIGRRNGHVMYVYGEDTVTTSYKWFAVDFRSREWK